jgi:hypothetical protein
MYTRLERPRLSGQDPRWESHFYAVHRSVVVREKLSGIERSLIYLRVEHNERIKLIVVYGADLLFRSPSPAPYTPLELVMALGRGGPGAISGEPSLADAVAGMPQTIRRSTADIITGAAELFGASELGALVLGELGGSLITIALKPLTDALLVGAELLNIFSLLLPAGDARAWMSAEVAEEWTQRAIIHEVNDYLPQWSSCWSLLEPALRASLKAAIHAALRNPIGTRAGSERPAAETLTQRAREPAREDLGLIPDRDSVPVGTPAYERDHVPSRWHVRERPSREREGLSDRFNDFGDR